MKKSIFMAAMLLVSAFGLAQKLNVVGSPGLDVQFKRCVVNGSNCYFDFLLTNTQNNTKYFEIREQLSDLYTGVTSEFKLWDDEGNVLNGKTYNCIVSNEKAWFAYLPKDVPVKVRIMFSNIDEYATEFKLLDIPTLFDSHIGYIELRNVPIVRHE